MACCAFAIFLLGQFYVIVGTIARALGMAPSGPETTRAADWHLGAMSAAPEPLPLRPAPVSMLSKRTSIAALVSATALVVAVAARSDAKATGIQAYLADHIRVCVGI